jgi:hypothetical protein
LTWEEKASGRKCQFEMAFTFVPGWDKLMKWRKSLEQAVDHVRNKIVSIFFSFLGRCILNRLRKSAKTDASRRWQTSCRHSYYMGLHLAILENPMEL